MAVQAHYPSNALLFNRGGTEQERKDQMGYSSQQQQHLPPGFVVDQTTPLFFAAAAKNGVNGNQRKRGREAAAAAYQMVPTPQLNLLTSPTIQSPALVSLAQLQSQAAPPSMVSTGLKLSFDGNNNNNNNNQTQNQSQLRSQSTRFVQQDLASLINNQRDEIEQYLLAQGEQLRRTLADTHQRHYRLLLAAAEEAAARRLREKDIELDRAVRKTAELEERIARLRTESLTWQAKAMSDQATAESLHAQIQQAHRRLDECGDSAAAAAAEAAEDAESAAHVDADPVERWVHLCRACRGSPVSVVLLPCRHLCLCSACDASVGDSDSACCPVCHAVRTGSVQVFLS